MHISKAVLMVLLCGIVPAGAGGCGLQDEWNPCPDTDLSPACHPGTGDGSGGVRVTVAESITFEWNGTGADSVLLFRGSSEVWAIRPTPGGALLASPLVYGSHPANSATYIDSLPTLTTSSNYIVRVRRAGQNELATVFGFTAP